MANRHGLKYEGYNIPNVLYEYVCQDDQPDFIFLNTRCKLEGCAFLVYDGKLVVYGEQELEAGTPAKTMTLDTTAKFNYSDNTSKSYKSADIVNGSITGTYSATSEQGSRHLRKIINIPMHSIGEAERFAKNLLRLENKNQKTGTIQRDIQRDLAAGSVINLKTTGAQSWDGPAFITHIRHDLVHLKSKIDIRRPLNY